MAEILLKLVEILKNLLLLQFAKHLEQLIVVQQRSRQILPFDFTSLFVVDGVDVDADKVVVAVVANDGDDEDTLVFLLALNLAFIFKRSASKESSSLGCCCCCWGKTND